MGEHLTCMLAYYACALDGVKQSHMEGWTDKQCDSRSRKSFSPNFLIRLTIYISLNTGSTCFSGELLQIFSYLSFLNRVSLKLLGGGVQM